MTIGVENKNSIPSIQSIKNKYTVDKILPIDNKDVSYALRDYYASLSEKRQNLMIDTIQDFFNSDGYIGLYELGSRYLDFLYSSSKEKIKKRIIELWYNKICFYSYLTYPIGESEFYTEETKIKMINILKNKWNEEEIFVLKKRIRQNLIQDKLHLFKQEAKEIIKYHNNTSENQIIDSIVNANVESEIQKYRNHPMPAKYIYMIGSLKDVRFIPYLEFLLNHNYREDNKWVHKSCNYALAKIGVQSNIDSALNSEVINYKYLGTKESILKYLKNFYKWDISTSMCSICEPIPLALVTLFNVGMYVENTPKSLLISPRDIEQYNNNQNTIQKADSLHKWFFENKDLLELPVSRDY
jgi:hypothetical protein